MENIIEEYTHMIYLVSLSIVGIVVLAITISIIFGIRHRRKNAKIICTSCGTKIDKDSLYCKHCGIKIGEETLKKVQ